VTIGATYQTTRGTFKVLALTALGVKLERADGRYILAAQSDWPTWQPQLLETPE